MQKQIVTGFRVIRRDKLLNQLRQIIVAHERAVAAKQRHLQYAGFVTGTKAAVRFEYWENRFLSLCDDIHQKIDEAEELL